MLRKLNVFFKSGKEVAILPFHVEQLQEFKDEWSKYRLGTGGSFTFTDIQPHDVTLVLVLDEIEFYTESTVEPVADAD